MVDEVECIVIGAGVVGLACARALAISGKEVIVLEAEDSIGTHTSARNSEVIHAGIYYPPESNKARLCRIGRDMLYSYCLERGIEHQRLGKLIVATNSNQTDQLRKIYETARFCGVDDLEWQTEEDIYLREPSLSAVRGIWSPSTGIIDSHGFMISLQGEAEAYGATTCLMSCVDHGSITPKGIEITVQSEPQMTLRCRYLVNAAGLWAQSTAASIQGLSSLTIPAQYYARGVYFVLKGSNPFKSLIYPIPGADGLGVHVTLDLGGRARFGPDVQWIDAVDYTVVSERSSSFYAAIRSYWPDLPDGALEPGYAGIRPKLKPCEDGPSDFVIQGPNDHGITGLVNLYGIESPGLTSSMAIANEVVSVLEES